MPEYSQWRIEKAEGLEKLFNELNGGNHSVDSAVIEDWKFVVGFYAALHYCDAFLENEGIDLQAFEGHGDRHDALRNQARNLWRKYRALKSVAWQVRYKEHAPSQQDRNTFCENLPDLIRSFRKRVNLPA